MRYQSFSQIIEALGGAPEVARMFGVGRKNVNMMSSRQSIDDRFWHLIEKEAAARGMPGMTIADCQRLKLARFPDRAPRGARRKRQV